MAIAAARTARQRIFFSPGAFAVADINNRSGGICRLRRAFSDHDAATAVTSTSTLNSGRVKPETITSVEANALPAT